MADFLVVVDLQPLLLLLKLVSVVAPVVVVPLEVSVFFAKLGDLGDL